MEAKSFCFPRPLGAREDRKAGGEGVQAIKGRFVSSLGEFNSPRRADPLSGELILQRVGLPC